MNSVTKLTHRLYSALRCSSHMRIASNSTQWIASIVQATYGYHPTVVVGLQIFTSLPIVIVGLLDQDVSKVSSTHTLCKERGCCQRGRWLTPSSQTVNMPQGVDVGTNFIFPPTKTLTSCQPIAQLGPPLFPEPVLSRFIHDSHVDVISIALPSRLKSGMHSNSRMT